ncbi:MAG: hypothetical protein AAGA03_11770, partial [Planctomycetota bacterium]
AIPICIDAPENQPSLTRMRFPVFPGSAWSIDGPPKMFRDIIDGTSNTIAVIHAPADAATPWASPDPWILSEDDPVTSVFGDRGEVMVLMFDGGVRVLRRDETPEDLLCAMLTIAGRETINIHE